MNCKETEKSIPSFLKGELEGDRLAEFVEHIEQCPECKEELSIQFLVTEGMEKLEEGSSFNLQKALHDRMEEWYDGYRFGNVDVYCPWDVINFCSDHLADSGLEPKNYWAAAAT